MHNQIDVSVVICSYNRASLLPRVLDTVLCQVTKKLFSYEIVLIDDGSTDNTEKVAKSYGKNQNGIPVSYLNANGVGVAAARNKGVMKAAGVWIVFFDDDQWAEPGWLAELFRTVRQEGVDCAGGAIKLDLTNTEVDQLGAFCKQKLLSEVISTDRKIYETGILPATGNVIVHKNVFKRIGTFDSTMVFGSSDADFFIRAKNDGITMAFAPNAIVHHIIPEQRLRHAYLKNVSLKKGFGAAWIIYHNNPRVEFYCWIIRYTIKTLFRDIWIYLFALSANDRILAKDSKYKLFLNFGFVRGGLSLLFPRLFQQKGFIKNLNFRTRNLKKEIKIDNGNETYIISRL